MTAETFDHLSDREVLLLTAERLGTLTDKVEDLSNKVGDQNGRIGKLESWRLQMVGAGVLVLALMPFLVVIVNRIFESGG